MFSADAQYLVSNSKDCQILMWKTHNGELLRSLATLRDTKWVQWSCPLGWPVVGVWKAEYDLTDINTVCQSYAFGRQSIQTVAVGDDMGRVLLYRFPTPYAVAEGWTYFGHASHVTNV